MQLSKAELLEMYRKMLTIRKFEDQAAESFETGDVQGFVHLSIGEEAVPTGVCAGLKVTDYITSTHRGHGHVLAKGADPKIMLAELCGRVDGYNHGKGGSMHIANIDLGVLGANGIVGAGQTLAVGAALATKMKGRDDVVVCFFGDGASNEGSFHESLNAAAIWKLPVVFVCTNNLYAISTRVDRSVSVENISDRAAAYGIPGKTADGNNVVEVYKVAKEAIERARRGEGPSLLEFKSFKWHGHFEGDAAGYRPIEELNEWKAKDPIARHRDYLLREGVATEDELTAIEQETTATIQEAIEFALNSEFPGEDSVVRDVYTDIVEEGR